MNISAVPSSTTSWRSSVHDLGLHRDVERRRRLVGDQQRRPAGQGHGDPDALALAAGELVRVGTDDALGIGQADPVAQLLGGDGGRTPAEAPVQAQRLGDLPPDAHHRVERRARVLEDHGDAVAAQLGVPAVGPAEQLLAVEADAAGDGRRVGRQPDDRQRGQRLARAGLADDPEASAVGDVRTTRRRRRAARRSRRRGRRPRAARQRSPSGAGRRPGPRPVDDAGERRRRRRRAAAQARVDGVAQAVAEQVEAERGERRRPARGTRARPGGPSSTAAASPASAPTTASTPASARGSSAPPRRARRGRRSATAAR